MYSVKGVFKGIAEIAVLLLALPLVIFAFGAPIWFGALTIYAWLLGALSLIRTVVRAPGLLAIAAVVVLIVIVWQSKHRRQQGK